MPLSWLNIAIRNANSRGVFSRPAPGRRSASDSASASAASIAARRVSTSAADKDGSIRANSAAAASRSFRRDSSHRGDSGSRRAIST